MLIPNTFVSGLEINVEKSVGKRHLIFSEIIRFYEFRMDIKLIVITPNADCQIKYLRNYILYIIKYTFIHNELYLLDTYSVCVYAISFYPIWLRNMWVVIVKMIIYDSLQWCVKKWRFIILLVAVTHMYFLWEIVI